MLPLYKNGTEIICFKNYRVTWVTRVTKDKKADEPRPRGNRQRKNYLGYKRLQGLQDQFCNPCNPKEKIGVTK